MLFERIQEIAEKWAPHRDGMLKAIEATHGTHTEDDVLAMILAGSLRLTVSEKSAIVTEVCTYPRMKALNAFLCSGKLADIIAHEPTLIALAKEHGCTRVTFGGIPKWEAAMCQKPNGPGWEVGGVFLYKDI
jgi:hypothetical protein